MGLNSKERLRTAVLLLILSRVVYTEDLSHLLHCVNDYVSTINCTLQSNLTPDLTIWLKLEEEDEEEEEIPPCHLSWDNDHFFCSVEYDMFVDTTVFKIFLCSEGRSCDLLDEKYRLVKNIKPNPPCCLTLEQNSSQHRFTWESTYEEEIRYTALPKELKYQLHLNQVNGSQRDINTEQNTFTLQEEFFKPDSEYVAKVRSSPNQAFYAGEWSDWSPSIHWRTLPTVQDIKPVVRSEVFNLKNLLVPLCVLVPVILSLLFATVKKWRQKVFIPTPEPYFHTLYTDCHGDFKSWVIMEKTEDLPKTEKTSQIEKIFNCEDIQKVTPSSPVPSEYANMSRPQCVLPEPGVPYAVSTSGLDSATASCTSAYLSPQSRSPTEGDSGCWLSSGRSLEQGHLWYCNDYCTLSTFQQSALGTAGGSQKCATCLIMRHDDMEETHCISG